MSIITADICIKKVNGNNYQFQNNFRKNYSGFVHETVLFRNGEYVGENKIQYYNRTWEVYTHQSVMKGLIRNVMDAFMEEYISNWKEFHNIKRLTAQKKEVMMEEFQNNVPAEYAELEKLYSML
jgi:hypothetical protein